MRIPDHQFLRSAYIRLLLSAVLLAAISVLTVFATAGCDGRAKVVITGKILRWNTKRDTIFVTLTRNWESIKQSPDSFSITPQGEFELQFTVMRNVPPVTFIRNNEEFAVLTINNLRGPSPMVVEEMRNLLAEIRFQDNAFRVKLNL